MTLEGSWLVINKEVLAFIKKEHRKLSKYYPEERLMFHFIHPNRKLYYMGTMKEERKVLSKELLALCKGYERINQYL